MIIDPQAIGETSSTLSEILVLPLSANRAGTGEELADTVSTVVEGASKLLRPVTDCPTVKG